MKTWEVLSDDRYVGWLVRLPNGTTIYPVTERRRAIQVAVDAARADGAMARVVIRRASGSVEETRTYEPED